MAIKLEKAQETDAQQLLEMQHAAFLPLLEKYLDFDTSPATEPLEKMEMRIREPDGGVYKIIADGKLAGAIRIRRKEGDEFWIGPLFIAPCFQGGGLAQAALRGAEELYPEAASWHLGTLLEEAGNCHLYEKMGYARNGRQEKLNPRATLVYYEKHAAKEVCL
ncbi:GNAT family N-acetyltransferase [Planococcus sp. FY231025]|uniref:GNAT family N-acetyltransferase n=1 Tax=Planococcus sp. FY231025 TaxID=3455699 RepID=UPI003F910FC2